MNIADMNIHVQVFVLTCVFISLGYMLKVGIAESNVKSVFNFLSSIRSYLFIFVFISITLGGKTKRILPQFRSKSVLPMFTSRSCLLSGLNIYVFTCV